MRSTRAAGSWTCPRVPRSMAGGSSQTCGAAPQCPGSGVSRRDSNMLGHGWTPGRLVGDVQSVHLHQEVVEHLSSSELEKQDRRVECFLLRAWIPAGVCGAERWVEASLHGLQAAPCRNSTRESWTPGGSLQNSTRDSWTPGGSLQEQHQGLGSYCLGPQGLPTAVRRAKRADSSSHHPQGGGAFPKKPPRKLES